MRRFFLILVLFTLGSVLARADTALGAFTNQANRLLTAQFGFDAAHIPIYSPTNPSIRYTAGLHYSLQAAADLYDATTPATNYPSVFRPLFSLADSNLFIVGFTNVTTDLDTQLARGFKDADDPSITANDNVWGIPWVVGAKDNIPQFNEFNCANIVAMTRKLNLVRPFPSATFLTLTNQLYEFVVSNQLGAEIWINPSQTNQTPRLTITDVVSIKFTNNYDWGTNLCVTVPFSNLLSDWQPDSLFWPDAAFAVANLTNLTLLPLNEWRELSKAMVWPPPPPLYETNRLGLPVHSWELDVTNHLVGVLADDRTGPFVPLDFVNVTLGSALNLAQVLTNASYSTNEILRSWQLVWGTNGADDNLDSPASSGITNQLLIGAGLESVADWPVPPGDSSMQMNMQLFRAFLTGPGNSGTNLWMDCPFQPTVIVLQRADWPAANPKVHYTTQDLSTVPLINSFLAPLEFQILPPGLGLNLSWNLGLPNLSFRRATPFDSAETTAQNHFVLSFQGVPDLPYLVWSSTNLTAWSLEDTATQSTPGSFSFTIPLTNAAAKFFQVFAP